MKLVSKVFLALTTAVAVATTHTTLTKEDRDLSDRFPENTPSPTPDPTLSPSSIVFPTGECDFVLVPSCVLADGPLVGRDCETPALALTECEGTDSCLLPYALDILFNLPISALFDDLIEIDYMYIYTDFTDVVDLTDQVAGQIIGPDNPSFVVTLTATVDASTRETYNFEYEVGGFTLPTGYFCMAYDMFSLQMGPNLDLSMGSG